MFLDEGNSIGYFHNRQFMTASLEDFGSTAPVIEIADRQFFDGTRYIADHIAAASLSPDEQRVCIVSRSGEIELFDRSDGKLIWQNNTGGDFSGLVRTTSLGSGQHRIQEQRVAAVMASVGTGCHISEG